MARRKLSKQQTLPDPDRKRALARTVQEFPDGGGPISFILQLALAADEAPKWWSPARDRYLDKFWPTEPFLAGAIYSVSSRNASFRWELTGPRDQVKWSQRLLCQADFGDGWQSFMMKVTQDLLCQGNGAFIEVIRPAKARINGKSYDAVRAQHPDSEEYIWYAYDRSTGEVYNQYDYGFKVQDSVFSLPIGIAHLDSARCLGRDSRVLMADGSTKSILSLVRSKSEELVMTCAKDGKLSPGKIVGWHEIGLGDHHWLRLHLSCAKRTYGRKEGLWLTNDHQVLTPDGWVEAESLSAGDRVVTMHPAPSKGQAEVLVGTLLGDASLSWSGRNPKRLGIPCIGLVHSAKQSEWLKLKMSAFSGFTWGPIRRNHKDILQTETHVTPSLFAWRDDWYPNRDDRGRHGRKVTPRQLIQDNFTPLMLATWYADDGNLQRRKKWGRPSVRLYTNGFSKQDVDWLASLLTANGYRPKVYPMRGRTGTICYYIYLPPDSSEKFLETVAPYLPPCVRHKLPDGYPDFDPKLWASIRPAERFVDVVADISSGTNGEQAATFCIDVEDTHNFIAGGMVVHNCTRTGNPDHPVVYTDLQGGQHKLGFHQVLSLAEMPSPREEWKGVQVSAVDRVLRLSQILRDLSTYKSEKVSGRFARAIHLTNIDADTIQDAVNQANESADSRGLLRYMQPIVAATLDPNARPEVATLELASLPSGFDEETTMRWYIAGLATVLGVDYGFLAPLPGSKLGTAAQAETQERQARGKSSRLFMRMLAHKFNYSGVLPRSVVFKFAQTDPYEESERDRAFARRTRARSTAIQSGEITDAIARQLACDVGDLDPKYLAMMGEGDISPIITVDGETMIMEPGELLPRHLVPGPPTQSGRPEEREE